MKILLKYFAFPLLILAFGVAHSQELKNKFGEVYYTPGLYKSEYHAAEGSPYLNEQFAPAKINDIAETKLVRFDAFKDQVEIMDKGNSVMILDDSEPYVITLLNDSKDVYKTKAYLDKGIEEHSFFKLIKESDDYELYIKEEIKFYKEVKPLAYEEGQPAHFKKEQSRFFISDFAKDKNILIEVPNRLNKFVDLFPDASKKMKEYIKKDKLDLDEERDLIEILDHYFNG